jgi:hypothetical protein
MMNHKLQHFPISGTRESREHLPSGKPWANQPANPEGAKFFRSWLVYDFDMETTVTHRRVDWNVILGLGLATALSASFWATLGLMMARLWN